MKKKRLYSILILLCFTLPLRASFDFNTRCQSALQEIFALQITRATQLIRDEKQYNPDNRIPLLLEDYIDFFTLYFSEDEKLYKTLVDDKERRLKLLEKEQHTSPWLRYCQGDIHLHWALLKVKMGDFMSGAGELNKAYHLLKENNKLFPSFLPNTKSLGLIHIIFGSVPDNMTWARKLLSLEGTADQGRNEISSVIRNSKPGSQYSFLREEACILLIFMELNEVHEKEKMADLFSLLDANNIPSMARSRPVIAYAYATLLQKAGKGEEACRLLTGFSKAKDQLPLPYLDFLTGVSILNKLDTTSAVYFRFFLTRYKGGNNVKAAWQRLAWIELLKGNPEGYSRKIESMRYFGTDRSEIDKQAERETESHAIPNLRLLKARLLTDGGYYKQALDVLLQAGPSTALTNKHDSLEYIYRLGRIYQQTGDNDKAIREFDLLIKKGQHQPWYFAANAACLMGNIYEEKKDYTTAGKYYKTCLQTECKEYKYSIYAKAKEGLQRIERIKKK